MLYVMSQPQGQTETRWVNLKLWLLRGPTSREDEEFWEADDEDEDHEDEEFSECGSCHGSTMRSHTLAHTWTESSGGCFPLEGQTNASVATFSGPLGENLLLELQLRHNKSK